MNTYSTRRMALIAAATSGVLLLGACSSDDDGESQNKADFTSKSIIEAGAENPMIAEGVIIGPDAYFYKSSGLGPAALNEGAPEASVDAYVDTSMFEDGALTGGVTITEAQGLNALAQIKDNLEAQGLTLQDVVSMRVFLVRAPGAAAVDYAGWNRAYRQYFANTDLKSEDTELVPLGTGEPAAPLERNPARPSRYAIEVGSLPVPGWLVELEVDAVYPAGDEPKE